jgi:allophanate hydrolase
VRVTEGGAAIEVEVWALHVAMVGDVIVTPTAGTHYRIDAVAADPIQLNSNLGYYTNFVNLLDLAAVAVPSGFQANGLPFGITLLAPAFYDHALLQLAGSLHHAASLTLGTSAVLVPALTPASDDAEFLIAVCGAHMSGLALNHELTVRSARLLSRTHTAACYRLYLLPGGPPQRPGLVRVTEGGAAIEVEVWALPVAMVGDFIAGIPAPLGIGRVALADGTEVSGFVCEGYVVHDALDITVHNGWRGFLKNGRADS